MTDYKQLCTDYKQLCAELVTELEAWCGTGTYDNTANDHLIIARARAALAKSEPPADLELRVQRLEAMRETEKAALLDAFKQIDKLQRRLDFQYTKIHRLEEAMPATTETTDD